MKNKLALAIAISFSLSGCSSDSAPQENSALNESADYSSIQTQTGFFAYYTKASGPQSIQDITGPYADIVINIENKGLLRLSAENSYLPVWQYEEGNITRRQAFNHLAPALAQNPPTNNATRFDTNNNFSYARIIEQTPDEITLHWRYIPEPNALIQSDPEAVVHELISVKSDGSVTRIFRPGTDTIEQWQSFSGVIEQILHLTSDGLITAKTEAITMLGSNTPHIPSPLQEPSNLVNPVARWRFDEGQGQTIDDEIMNASGELDSHGNDWTAGVSGSALRFDGYRSQVSISAENMPTLQSEMTIESWVYLAAYPWADAPILHQTQANGMFFGITDTGALTVKVANTQATSQQPLPTNQWLHVSASLGEQLKLFVNGQVVHQSTAPDNITLPTSEVIIGLNSKEIAATEGVRPDDLDEFHHFSSIFGIEAILDEIALYDRALSDSDIFKNYQQQVSGLSDLTTMEKRQLPDLENYPQTFGAYHTRLKFHDMWDNLWRVTEYEDIVIRFDNKPISLAYWRGTSHGMNLVTDGKWMSDQSVEMIIPDMEDQENQGLFNDIVSLAEHMSDKAALRTHVRLIENTPARIRVHWRYAAADVFGSMIMDNAFIDEIHTIYPDGVAIRDVYYHAAENKDDSERPGVVFYQDFQWLLNPGQKAEDIMNRTAVSLAELDGGQQDLFYPYQYQQDEGNESIPEKGNIAVLNSKTDWKVFGISQGNTFYPSTNDERSPHITFEDQTFPFAGPWNHWPVAQIPSDGRFSVQDDRVSHFALGVLEAFRYGSGSMMYGFLESQASELGDPTKLQTLAKSWISSPSAQSIQGIESNKIDYDKNDRAFHFTASSHDIQWTLNASTNQPLKNPAFVVHQWNSERLPEVTVNNQIITDLKMGISRDTDGSQMLVLFLPFEHNASTTIGLQLSQEN